MGSYTYHLALSGLLLLVLLIGLSSSAVVQAQNTNFSFSSFTTADRDSFLMVDDVQYDAGNLSFLMNSNGNGTFSGTCGRLLYKDKVRMKDLALGAVASFHTTFTFQISGLDLYRNADVWYHGDGIAFTFARANTFLDESGGASFCLVNKSKNGLLSNHLFAVEFDTYLNPEVNDSSDSHIGVDINSVSSTWSYNLCSGRNARNCQYLCNGGYFTAWIDYDSPSQNLQVFFANGSLYNNIPKPLIPLINASLASTIPLADLVDDYMYVGFSGSTGLFSEVHQIQSWEFTSYGMSELGKVSHGRKDIGIIAGVSVAVVATLVIGLCFVTAQCTKCWRRRLVWSMPESPGLDCQTFNGLGIDYRPDCTYSFRHFSYRELSRVTDSFSESRLLRGVGCSDVYKGIFPSGTKVAVKRVQKQMEKRCYLADMADLGDVRHRNLVQLQGWCYEKDQLLLVYDYMCNGSLDEWLYRHSSKQNGKGFLPTNNIAASLMLRHSVLSDVAAALSYLHEVCSPCMLHGNIKSSNVLLDGDWNAKLGDFGLAYLFGSQEIEGIVGTIGYIAPELLDIQSPPTKESDVLRRAHARSDVWEKAD